MPGGKGKIRPEDNPKPFKKGNQMAKLKGKNTVLARVKNIIHEQEGKIIYKGAYLLYKSGKKKGQRTGRRVDVEVESVSADALAQTIARQLRSNPKMMMWFMEQESGKAVEKIKLTGMDANGDEAPFQMILGLPPQK